MEPNLNRRSALGLLAAGAATIPVPAATAPRGADRAPHTALLDTYVDAWRRRDLDAIVACMHPELRFEAPTGSLRGIADYRKATAQFLALVRSAGLRAKLISGDQAMLAFDFICVPPIGTSRVADLVTFRAGKIAVSELFFDTAPFKAFAEARRASAGTR